MKDHQVRQAAAPMLWERAQRRRLQSGLGRRLTLEGMKEKEITPMESRTYIRPECGMDGSVYGSCREGR